MTCPARQAEIAWSDLPGPRRARCRTCGRRRVNIAACGGGTPICRECLTACYRRRFRGLLA